MKTIYLYGIAGATDSYRVVRYVYIPQDEVSIMTINYEATMMKVRYPNIEHVYAMDNRRGLCGDYMNAFKKNSVESWAIFKDILEREGLKVY